MSDQERHYPMLEPCRIVIRTGNEQPPVRLPDDCLEAAGAAGQSLPKPYDFALEREVLKKKEERDEEYALISAGSREELKESVLARVKSVTKASEDVCIALLESNSYDAKTSIEAYFSSS